LSKSVETKIYLVYNKIRSKLWGLGRIVLTLRGYEIWTSSVRAAAGDRQRLGAVVQLAFSVALSAALVCTVYIHRLFHPSDRIMEAVGVCRFYYMRRRGNNTRVLMEGDCFAGSVFTGSGGPVLDSFAIVFARFGDWPGYGAGGADRACPAH
jgi:hypothetical protein